MKLLTSYINFTIARYIVEPIEKLDPFFEKYLDRMPLPDNRYINHPILPTILSKVVLKHKKVDWKRLSYNNSKWAIKMMEEDNFQNCDWKTLLKYNTNKKIPQLLNKYKPDCDNKIIYANPSNWAKKYVMKEGPKGIENALQYFNFNNSIWAYRLSGDITNLYENETPIAIKYIKEIKSEISYSSLVHNEKVGDFISECYNFPKDIKKLINRLVCANTKWALEIVKENIDVIDKDDFDSWGLLAHNPHIFFPNISKSNKYYKLFDKLLFEKLI